MPKRTGDLELQQDLVLQRREWIVERVGWCIMLLLLVAALLGAFGRGWLSHTSVADARGTLRLDYERLTRLQSTTELTVVLAPAALHGDTARVWIDREFMQALQIQHITPQPALVDVDTNRLTYVFMATEPERTVTIRFAIQPRRAWRHHGRIGLPGERGVSFTQFVYP